MDFFLFELRVGPDYPNASLRAGLWRARLYVTLSFSAWRQSPRMSCSGAALRLTLPCLYVQASWVTVPWRWGALLRRAWFERLVVPYWRASNWVRTRFLRLAWCSWRGHLYGWNNGSPACKRCAHRQDRTGRVSVPARKLSDGTYACEDWSS